MLAAQLFIRFDVPEFGGELFKLGAALRDDLARERTGMRAALSGLGLLRG